MTDIVPEGDEPTPEPASGAPPVEISGQEVLDAEPKATDEDGNDTRPTLKVRADTEQAQQFHLRMGVPNALLGRVQKLGKGVDKLAAKKGDDLTDAEKERLTNLQIAIYDSLVMLVVADERDTFIDWAIEVDPPVEGEEWSKLMASAIEAITGRPTGPSSA